MMSLTIFAANDELRINILDKASLDFKACQ